MLVFLHEMLLKVPTPLILSLKPYGLAVTTLVVMFSIVVSTLFSFAELQENSSSMQFSSKASHKT